VAHVLRMDESGLPKRLLYYKQKKKTIRGPGQFGI
jgi:hypothetical protein